MTIAKHSLLNSRMRPAFFLYSLITFSGVMAKKFKKNIQVKSNFLEKGWRQLYTSMINSEQLMVDFSASRIQFFSGKFEKKGQKCSKIFCSRICRLSSSNLLLGGLIKGFQYNRLNNPRMNEIKRAAKIK